MNNIFQTLLYQREKQKDTVLATIVWDDGSAPRGAGSQMLVGAEGLLSGTIGGGAVELRSIQLARALLAGQHVDALYDFKLSRDGELGMACGGDVTVLFTPARLSDRVWDALAAARLAGAAAGRCRTPYRRDGGDRRGRVLPAAAGWGARGHFRRGTYRSCADASAADDWLPSRGGG